MTTEFKTCFTKILAIKPHPDIETTQLEISVVYGFEIITRKNSMKVGDIIFFIPIDSVLNKEIEDLIFPESSKIKLHKSRVKQIKIRNFPSAGLLVETNLVIEFLKSKGFNLNAESYLDKDISNLVGISKYQPPVPKFQQVSTNEKVRRMEDQPLFHQYNGLLNIRWNPDLFAEDEDVIIQLKYHGTNARLSMLPTVANSLWKRFKKYMGWLPAYEIRYGSNCVDITAKQGKYTGYYGEDVYGTAFKLCNAAHKIQQNEIIYGEIIGENIQKGYHYGHKAPQFVLFDVKVFDTDGNWRWLSPKQVEAYAIDRNFQFVKVLYEGKYNRAIIDALVSGPDDYYPAHTKEGIVIKSVNGYNDTGMSSRKRALKFINPKYLEKDQSEHH